MKTKWVSFALSAALAFTAIAAPCHAETAGLGLNAESKPATQYTIDANQQVYQVLDFTDTREFDNAQKGFIAAPEVLEIFNDGGKLVWSQNYDLLKEAAPDTANPSLWRDTQLNNIYGLFQVTDGIYQVRGYDMSNVTFIEGETGWIVVDPLMSVECSKAALELVKENLGDRPIHAVIYSHSHVDHFGGVRGVINEDDVLAGKVQVIAPEGFEEHAISENIYAGSAMSRRASYMYGNFLTKGDANGSLCIGIGMGQSTGTASFISPTKSITKTGETMVIDGVKIEFQLTPGTEAPAEMNFWIADKNALWMAENCTGTMHNLYTLRGAQVRDGNAWAEYIMESLAMYGDKAEVVFQSHNWPHWGNETIQEYLINTAAAYKFINDQTLLYMNMGYTDTEIANMIRLPEELEKVWYIRQYYGTVAHNSKAVYEKYMGWYDANPVHLAELTPSDYATKLVEYLGDTDAVLAMAKADYDKGEYQWVAQITNTLVFADPTNMEARYLCADALEQLGYQAESGPWRNVYLCAAQELRLGTNMDEGNRASGNTDAIAHMSPEMIFEYIGILADTEKIADLTFTANVVLPTGNYVLRVKNGVVLYQKNTLANDADVTWTTNRMGLLSIVQKNANGIAALVAQEGDETCLTRLVDAITVIAQYRFFNIVEP